MCSEHTGCLVQISLWARTRNQELFQASPSHPCKVLVLQLCLPQTQPSPLLMWAGCGSGAAWHLVPQYIFHAGCPSVQQCSLEMVSRFLLSSILVEVVNLVTALASDTTVKVFEKIW